MLTASDAKIETISCIDVLTNEQKMQQLS